jgi:hypothetical protein
MRNGRTTYERGKQSAVRPAGSTRTTRKVTECAASVPDASLPGRSAAAEAFSPGLGRTFPHQLDSLSVCTPVRGGHYAAGSIRGAGGGFSNFGLTHRYELGGYALRQCPEWHPGSGLPHAQHVGGARVWIPRKVGAEARTGYARCS